MEPPLSPPWNFSDLLDFDLDVIQETFGVSTGEGSKEEDDGSGEAVGKIGGDEEDVRGKGAIGGEVMVGGGDDVAGPSNRVRKQDPRLVCSNFLAGQVPCACPELDEAEAEEKEEPRRKRPRAFRAVLTCQVPGCGMDIGGLKGYHKRHKVCLVCAGAGDVEIDGKRKRYCQQCGKFHMLSAFDGDKRSCRRKLARHNDRRKRKYSASSLSAEREPQGVAFADDVAWDDDIGNGLDTITSVNRYSISFPINCSDPSSQVTIQNDSVVSLIASDEQFDMATPSPPKNKSAYSSTCPTGRISFKLYDWNPAEFPRRLRQQIFDWLASMPVEMEGYIRPGCPIFPAFISMPNVTWIKLRENPIFHIQSLIASSGKMLSGHDPLIIYLDDMIFHMKRDGTSVIKVKVKKQAPKLHYVHPRFFASGKPIEFVACGSNMLKPKFRFLVSFAGKYIAYGSCVLPLSGSTADSSSHQLLRVQIPPTEPDLFGPAFVEVDSSLHCNLRVTDLSIGNNLSGNRWKVENESGISNFIPILIGDKEICLEMDIMEKLFETSIRSEVSKFTCPRSLSNEIDVSIMSQTDFSQFVSDTAWLLKKPILKDENRISPSSQITRFSQLLTFLLENKSTNILERVLHHIESFVDNSRIYNPDEADFSMLQRNVGQTRKILYSSVEKRLNSIQSSCDRKGDCVCLHSEIDTVSTPLLNQVDTTGRYKLGVASNWTYEERICRIPLMKKEARKVESVKLTKKSKAPAFMKKLLVCRPLIFTIVASIICSGFFVVTFHPENVGKVSTIIRRCLFDDTS